MLSAVAVIIWFGVNLGLRPLLDLENAIAVRSSDDLSQIRRPVPREVLGIVRTLNALFSQVGEAIRTRDIFISDAAHQLRNPVAGMLALAEAAEAAASDDVRQDRLRDLKASAQRTARLTTQMLALERAKGLKHGDRFERLDLNALATEVASRNADRVLGRGHALEYHGPEDPVMVRGDPVMLEEALENLIDNALRHGPPALSAIEITLRVEDALAILSVRDDGVGFPDGGADRGFERFGSGETSDGYGLGLAIVAEVAATHGAELIVGASTPGAVITITLKRELEPTGSG